MLTNQRSEYPSVAPLVTFSPTIPHPNVFPSGVCIPDSVANWKSHFTLQNILQDVFNLLKRPDCADPSNLVATFDCLQSAGLYESKARDQASALAPSAERKIALL